MKENFRWNPYADQPHNVAPKRERFFHHFSHSASYVDILLSNVRKAVPILTRYRRYRKRMYRESVKIACPFGLAVSPAGERDEDLLECLRETGIRQVLFRIPSWERDQLAQYERFIEMLSREKMDVVVALLQRRDDFLQPFLWQGFLDEVFSRFRHSCSLFEVGHAWNRTKWGIWDHQEYLELARSAVSLAEKHGVKLLGPAVIDFEFHLYPPVLERVSFDAITSLLYVDRVGAPENTQFGWDISKKVALLRAVVDGTLRKKRELWITEVNWPLKGTGKHSPAAGKVNVSEDEQADYLIRYYILSLAGGFIQRIYWWQMAAPGYGLVDNLGGGWRKRPSFYAMKTLAAHLEGSLFQKKISHPRAEIFLFRQREDHFAVCWTRTSTFEHKFSEKVIRVLDREGKDISSRGNRIIIDGSPKYVHIERSHPGEKSQEV
jgi:hypothetical protein